MLRSKQVLGMRQAKLAIKMQAMITLKHDFACSSN